MIKTKMVKNIKEITKDFEEILERDVSEFGSGSHAILPKKHKGKKAIVLIKK